METKTSAFNCRSSSSTPHSNASLTSPLVNQAEHNEENHLHGNGNGKSEDTGSHQDDDDKYADNEEEGGGAGSGRRIAGDEDDNAVDPDFVEEAGESAGVECILGYWLGVFYYGCSGGNSRVLVCCENGCPIALHELCMNYRPDFDETGKFYCAYCWYKQVVVRAKELRREALLAESNLLKFIHFKCDGGNGDGADNMKVVSLSTTAGEKNSGDCENGLKDDANETIYYIQEQTMCVVSKGKEKPDDESTSKAHGCDNVADGQMMQEEDIENTSDSENDASDEDPLRKQSFDPNHFEILNDTLYLSTKGTFEITGALEDDQGKSRKEEPVLPNAVTQEATSKVPAIESSEFASPDLDAGTLVAQTAQPQKVDLPKSPPFQPCTSAKDKMTNLQGKATTAENSISNVES
ncbi:hypothetical protein V6N13_106831 [Hibiscus sabdariffa]